VYEIGLDADLSCVLLDDTKVHEGFQDTQGRTADAVLAGVKSAIASTGVKNVLVAGHSLGNLFDIPRICTCAYGFLSKVPR
jgi:hypothetical protein